MRWLLFIWLVISPLAALATDVLRAHAISMFDSETPRYPADFRHFDYVNPDAPKGGSLRLAAQGSFDSFHPFIPKGNAVSTGAVETLLITSADEPFTGYGLIAETIEWPRDRAWVIFHIRPQARWHDGQQITAEDVVWSFETLVSQGKPQYRFYYGAVDSVEALDATRVRFTFSESNNRELPLIVGQLPILPKHYWATRDFGSTTLDPPLGSGPYQIADFEAGRFTVRQRVDNYWGKDLAVRQGLNNFGAIRTVFFRDATPIRLALKAGDIDFRLENQAKAWAEDYNVAVVEKGWLKKELAEHRMPTGGRAKQLHSPLILSGPTATFLMASTPGPPVISPIQTLPPAASPRVRNSPYWNRFVDKCWRQFSVRSIRRPSQMVRDGRATTCAAPRHFSRTRAGSFRICVS